VAVTEEPWRTWPDERRGSTPPGPPAPGRWYLRRELHLAAGIAVAILTVFFAGQRAADGVRATLDARLVAAGAGADASVVGIEAEQLDVVRSVEFTQGAAQALGRHDGPALNKLVAPLEANSAVPMVDVVEPDGRVLLAVRAKGAPAPVASRKGLKALQLALAGAHGPRGGRLSEVVIYRSGPTLMTIGPIVLDGKAIGAVLAMTPLADVLGRTSQEVNAELTVYDTAGDPIATTATFDPKPIGSETAQTLIGGGAIVTRYDWADHREKLGRLIVDHEPDAVLGVAFEDDSNVTGRTVSMYVALGLLCAGAIFAGLWARVLMARRRLEP
jgi:hypothetical protein